MYFCPKEPNSDLGMVKAEKKQTKKLLKRKTCKKWAQLGADFILLLHFIYLSDK